MSDRVCKYCEQSKPDSEYYPRNKSKCKQCVSDYVSLLGREKRARERLLREPKQKQTREEYLEKKRQQKQTPQGKYMKYKQKAKERNIDFELSKEAFLLYWQQPCYYCGAEIATIGLDRIINSKGYAVNNIVPSCPWCNRMKMDHDHDEFLRQVRLIAEKHSG